jgi:hypothetical protein
MSPCSNKYSNSSQHCSFAKCQGEPSLQIDANRCYIQGTQTLHKKVGMHYICHDTSANSYIWNGELMDAKCDKVEICVVLCEKVGTHRFQIKVI